MKIFKNLIKSGYIHVALAIGMSIIVLTYLSKRVLTEPIRPVYINSISLLLAFYAGLSSSKKTRQLTRSGHWVLAIFFIAALIIIINII